MPYNKLDTIHRQTKISLFLITTWFHKRRKHFLVASGGEQFHIGFSIDIGLRERESFPQFDNFSFHEHLFADLGGTQITAETTERAKH